MTGDMKCPHCGETANFSVQATVMLAIVHSEDRGEEMDRPVWDEEEDIGCDSCGQSFTLKEFEEEAAKCESPSK